MAASIAIQALDDPGATLLCVGAHPDDIEIGAGATVATLVARHPALRVVWVVLTATAEREVEARASVADLLSGARAGASPLVLDIVEVHGLRDGHLPDQRAQVKQILEACKEHEPTLVLAPHLGDRHQDHRVVAEVVWQTFRDHLIWAYEIPKYEGDLGIPNVFVALDEAAVQRKVDHLLTHFESQHNRQWYDESLFRAVLRLRGVESATRWAEAFHAAKLTL